MGKKKKGMVDEKTKVLLKKFRAEQKEMKRPKDPQTQKPQEKKPQPQVFETERAAKRARPKAKLRRVGRRIKKAFQ